MKIYFLLLLLFATHLHAQLIPNFLGPDQNPNLDWKKIDTDHYEITFPKELEQDGKRVADTLEKVYVPLSKTLKTAPTKITILLFNQSTASNAMVTLAPRRSEWYTTPPSTARTFGSVEWLQTLAIHEIRHVVQMDAAKRGFTKVAYVMLGEIGWALTSNLALPFWVWEGDAVGLETALSQSGRGRLPDFDRAIRTILMSGENYNYQKAYLGSYKDFYPNHYHLGYLLSTYIKNKYGMEAWEKIFRYAARKSYNPFALDNALLKVVGRGVEVIYQECMDELKIKWKNQLEAIHPTDNEPVFAAKKTWTNYEYPQVDDEGNLYVLKSGLSDIPKLVKITTDGKQHLLTVPGLLYGNGFNLSHSKIIWNEMRFDYRWGQKDYSSIKTYDIFSHKTKTLTTKSKYFSPAFNKSETEIAAIEILPHGLKRLVILDSSAKILKREFPFKDGTYYFNPYWFEDEIHVVLIKQENNLLSIVKLNTQSFKEEILYGPTTESLSRPVVKNNFVIFNSPQSGIDNLYTINLNSKKVFQITSRPYGAYNGYLHQGYLYYNDYQFMGMEVVKAKLQEDKLIPVEQIKNSNIKFYSAMAEMEGNDKVLENIPQKNHEVKNYNHKKDIFNTHSWVLLPNVLSGTLDAALLTQNKLSTFSSQLGYQYNTNEQTSLYYAQASYAGLYPIFDLSYSLGERYSTYETTNNETKTYTWKERTTDFEFRLPLNFSKEAYQTHLELSAGPSLIQVSDKTVASSFDQGNGDLKAMSYQIEHSHLERKALRDINPRTGEYVKLTYRHMPFQSNYRGKLTSVNSAVYMPGLFQHHSFWLNAAWEEQAPDNYRFRSQFMKPRGYEFEFKERFIKLGFNYTHPIALFDKNFGMMFNFKRLKQNLFYDHGVGKSLTSNKYYNSVGTELLFDMNLLNLKLPFDFGARIAYQLKEEKWDISPLFLSVLGEF